MIPKQLTGAEREDIRRCYLNGETATTLAAEYGVRVTTILSFVPRRRPVTEGVLGSDPVEGLSDGTLGEERRR